MLVVVLVEGALQGEVPELRLQRSHLHQEVHSLFSLPCHGELQKLQLSLSLQIQINKFQYKYTTQIVPIIMHKKGTGMAMSADRSLFPSLVKMKDFITINIIIDNKQLLMFLF